MDNLEAIEILERELDLLRRESYAELTGRIDLPPVVCDRPGTGGRKYQLEIQFFWDGNRGGHVRVMGSIDDGGWRAFVPITRSFIKAADGSFVGEQHDSRHDTRSNTRLHPTGGNNVSGRG